jgi:hypothetical protein
MKLANVHHAGSIQSGFLLQFSGLFRKTLSNNIQPCPTLPNKYRALSSGLINNQFADSRIRQSTN